MCWVGGGAILYFLGLEVFTLEMVCDPVSSAWTTPSHPLRPASTGFMSYSDVLRNAQVALLWCFHHLLLLLLVLTALSFNLICFYVYLCLPHWTVDLRHRACVVFI